MEGGREAQTGKGGENGISGKKRRQRLLKFAAWLLQKEDTRW